MTINASLIRGLGCTGACTDALGVFKKTSTKYLKIFAQNRGKKIRKRQLTTWGGAYSILKLTKNKSREWGCCCKWKIDDFYCIYYKQRIQMIFISDPHCDLLKFLSYYCPFHPINSVCVFQLLNLQQTNKSHLGYLQFWKGKKIWRSRAQDQAQQSQQTQSCLIKRRDWETIICSGRN